MNPFNHHVPSTIPCNANQLWYCFWILECWHRCAWVAYSRALLLQPNNGSYTSALTRIEGHLPELQLAAAQLELRGSSPAEVQLRLQAMQQHSNAPASLIPASDIMHKQGAGTAPEAASEDGRKQVRRVCRFVTAQHVRFVNTC